MKSIFKLPLAIISSSSLPLRQMSILSKMRRPPPLVQSNTLSPQNFPSQPSPPPSKPSQSEQGSTKINNNDDYWKAMASTRRRHLTPAGESARKPVMLPPEQPENPHILHVAIVGAPNAGKSSLLNAMLGQKVSIVSKKAQTTRDRVMGVLTEENRQIVFHDTPGILPPALAKEFQVQPLAEAAWDSMHDTDLTLFVVDGVARISDKLTFIMEEMKKEEMKSVLVLNKADLVYPKSDLLQIAEELNKSELFSDIFFVSAWKGLHVDELKQFLFSKAQPGLWKYHKEVAAAEASPLQIVEESIREQLLRMFNQEVPYVVHQENEGWAEMPDGSLHIVQTLRVKTPGQVVRFHPSCSSLDICPVLPSWPHFSNYLLLSLTRLQSMIIGTGGRLVRLLADKAAYSAEQLLRRPVRLFVSVRLDKS